MINNYVYSILTIPWLTQKCIDFGYYGVCGGGRGEGLGGGGGLNCLTCMGKFYCVTRYFKLCPAEYIKMPHPFLIFSQSDYLIRIVAIKSPI